MTPEEHIELIQLETRLIRARLQLKAAIAHRHRNRPNQTPEQKDSVALMVECCRVSLAVAKQAIALHNLGFQINSDIRQLGGES